MNCKPKIGTSLRVLHIGKYWSPRHGGIERFVEDLVLAQRNAGVDAFAIVHGEPGERQPARPSDPDWLTRVPVLREVAFVPIAPRFRISLKEAIEQSRPDYLHIHMPNASALWAFLLPTARRLPWVVHWHSDVVRSKHSKALRWLYPLYRPYERAVLDRAAVVIATSPQYLASSTSLAAYSDRSIAIPLGLREDATPSPSINVNEHWATATLRVLAIGRLTYYKGFDTLVSAIAETPGTSLVIVGEGEGRIKLERQIEMLGLQDRVRLLGNLEEDIKQTLLFSAQVFCLPSRERTEAFGLVLIEAMRAGLPLVVARLVGSGTQYLARHESNSLVAEIDDAKSWGHALSRLRDDPGLRRRLGAMSLKRCKEFDIGIVEQQLRTIVESTLVPDAPRPEAHERPLVVIPAKDEAPTIGAVVSAVLSANFSDVLVVDDRSSDDTLRLARESGAIALRAPIALGAWGAMQLGIRYALLHNYSSVITMDADGQHDAATIVRLLQTARDADVVIGSCTSRGSRARHFAWRLFRAMTGIHLEDLTSGFRLYNRRAMEVLAHADATLLDYQDIGVLLLLRKHRLTLAEVGVSMHARQSGRSRVFYSWFAVARYMIETSLLAITRRSLRTNRGSVPGTW